MPSTDPITATDRGPLRHARVWLDPATWRSRRLTPLDTGTVTALDDWISRGRAMVGRRRDAGSGDDACAVGVVLPPDVGKTRVALVVDRRAVMRIAPPLALDEAIGAAPPAWRAALTDLVACGTDADTSFRVYGSLAWQAISGAPYVGPGSDVDLLWRADGDVHIRRVLRLLVDWEKRHGLRADGELLGDDGDGIAWRELLGGASRVLVKHRDGVSLQPSPLSGARPDVRERDGVPLPPAPGTRSGGSDARGRGVQGGHPGEGGDPIVSIARRDELGRRPSPG